MTREEALKLRAAMTEGATSIDDKTASTALSYNRTVSYNVDATMKVGEYANYYYYTYAGGGSSD